ncbi:hypothetical protein [Bombiscardovia coagulans]|uniref:Helicase n=1 Tax=Bombiscardovia coagulans TaxID=686666 RepID=A0A261ETC4_9BIFI|nr:hypothetical protein [Bombiscardovia coagulans]OZG50075.1 hypothetical protein BOCO_0592 [Bombiscardovia coagulans]
MTDEARNGRRNEGSNRRRSGSGNSGNFHRGEQGRGGFKRRGSQEGYSGKRKSSYHSERRDDRRSEQGRGYQDREGRRSNYSERDDRRSSYQDHNDRRSGYKSRRQSDNKDGYRRYHDDDRRSNYRGHDRNDRRDDWNNRNNDSRDRYSHRGSDERQDRHRHYERNEQSNNQHRSSERRNVNDRRDRDGQNQNSYRDNRRQGSDYSRRFDRFDHNQRRGERSFDRNSSYQDGPRRNSDGTISYPSQNPYTDPRPGEPKMPKGLEWSMLSKDDKERLRGLSKEHAENIGLHILAAYALEETEPDRALAHAQWVARQASRVDIARETLALIAYRQGEYKLALREFRTAFRMNGYLDYLPFIADCERGLGHPKKAIEEATSEEGRALRGESKAEMFLVYAGALADLGLLDQAVETVRQLANAKGLSGDYRMRAIQAEQNFLDQAGRNDESHSLDSVLDKLEAEYADEDDENSDVEIIIDNDLEHATYSMLENLNIPTGDSHSDTSADTPLRETERVPEEGSSTATESDAVLASEDESDVTPPADDENTDGEKGEL